MLIKSINPRIVDFGICQTRLYHYEMNTRPLHRNDYVKLVVLLKQVRKEAGLTQVELAKRLGVEQSFVSKIERRERRLDLVELRFFCTAVGITLEEFVLRYEAKLTYPSHNLKNNV